MQIDFDGQAFDIDVERLYLEEGKINDIYDLVDASKNDEADEVMEDMDAFRDTEVNALPLLEQYHMNFCKKCPPYFDFKEKCSYFDEIREIKSDGYSSRNVDSCSGHNFDFPSHQGDICNPISSFCFNESSMHLVSPSPIPCNDRSDSLMLSLDQPLFQNQEMNTSQAASITNGDQCQSKKSNHIRRPMNAFMVWSRLERKKLARSMPHVRNPDLSKILGDTWKNMTLQERIPFIKEAERIKLLHSATFPEYKYKPKKRKARIKKMNADKQIVDDAINADNTERSTLLDDIVNDNSRQNNFFYGIDNFFNNLMGNDCDESFGDELLQDVQSDNNEIDKTGSKCSSYSTPCFYSDDEQNDVKFLSLDSGNLKNHILSMSDGLEKSFQFNSSTSYHNSVESNMQINCNDIGNKEYISYQTHQTLAHNLPCGDMPNKPPCYSVSNNSLNNGLYQNSYFSRVSNLRHKENLTLKDLVISNKPVSRNTNIFLNLNPNNDWINFFEETPYIASNDSAMQSYKADTMPTGDPILKQIDNTTNTGYFQNSNNSFQIESHNRYYGNDQEIINLFEFEENMFRKNISRSNSKDSGVDEIDYSSSRRSSLESLDDILMDEQENVQTSSQFKDPLNETETVVIDDQLLDQLSKNKISKSSNDNFHSIEARDSFLTDYSMFDYTSCPYYTPLSNATNEIDLIS